MRNSSQLNDLSVASAQVPYAPEYSQVRWPDARCPNSTNGQESLPATDVSVEREHKTQFAKTTLHHHEARSQSNSRSSIELMAMLVHEIRNPVSAISNGVELLMAGPLDSKQLSKLTGMMQRQVSQVTGLLDDFCDGVQLTHSALAIDHIPVDCTKVGLRALDTIGPVLEQKRHAMTISLPPSETAWVYGDQVRLIQVVVNLLSNAAKYTPPGGEIALHIAADSTSVTITVRDTGMGIPHGSLRQIFKLFTQGEQPAAIVNRGFGVGLCLVQNLVELHGGEVCAFSAGSGQGSTFTVTLPRMEHKSDIAY